MKKLFIKPAKLPRAAYDENLDLGKSLTKIKAYKGRENNPFTHWPSCRCKECHKI